MASARVNIARARSTAQKLVILDETEQALDESFEAEVLRLKDCPLGADPVCHRNHHPDKERRCYRAGCFEICTVDGDLFLYRHDPAFRSLEGLFARREARNP